MRNLKKFLALVLSMMMVLSLVVTASANSISGGKDQVFNDNSAIEAKFLKAVEVLNGMDVLKGDADASGAATGNFRPSATITRAEVAAMVFRLATGMTGAHDADHFAQYGNFSDVKDDAWYAGYVGYCANAGIIIGDGDGNFRPHHDVTGYEALVMLLRAMGYDQPDEFTGKDWRQHAASIATSRGLLAKVNTTRYRGTLMNGAAREVIAEITFQAATTAQVEWTAAFGYQTGPVSSVVSGSGSYMSLGRELFGLTSHSGIIVGNQETGEKGTLVSTDKKPGTTVLPAWTPAIFILAPLSLPLTRTPATRPVPPRRLPTACWWTSRPAWICTAAR